MAPEVTLGVPYSFAVDVWSAGVVCFACLSGEMPFDATASFRSVSYAIQNQLYDFESDVWCVRACVRACVVVCGCTGAVVLFGCLVVWWLS